MTYDTASVYRARTEAAVIFNSIADAAAYIREQMVNRAETVTFHFDTASDDFKGMAAAMMDEAVRHTGQSTEGDYLAFQYGGWQMSCSYSGSGADRDVVYTFHLGYYTTKEQETAVTDSLARVYKEIGLSMSESEYSRFKKIYDYVIAHVTYDSTHVGNASYKLPHTAYAALINKTCVCQGYTVLMYRMLLDWGIDTRIISGSADNAPHAWNIVRIGDLYYNADATWETAQEGYQYMLKGSNTFSDHEAAARFLTEEFRKEYPLAENSYLEDPYSVIAVSLNQTFLLINIRSQSNKRREDTRIS